VEVLVAPELNPVSVSYPKLGLSLLVGAAVVPGGELNQQDVVTHHRLWETGLAVLCAFTFVAKLLRGFPDNQWDFRVYYYAARAWADGVNPYVVGNLPPTSQGVFAFTYPPYALSFFWPLTLLPLQFALAVFLAVKLILLAWLMVIWSRVLRVSVTTPLWVLFLLFSYSSAIFIDCASGNIVVIEQWLLWTGLAFLLRKQYGAYVTAVVAASLFKLTPIVLLVMCFWIPDRRRYRYLAAGVAAFGCVLLSTYVISPRLTTDFFWHISTLDERATTNPALLALVRDASEVVSRTYGFVISRTTQTMIYALLAIAILVPTWTIARRVHNTQAVNRIELILYLVLLAWAITAPRFKNYAYMLVIVPTYYVATHSSRLPVAVPLLLIACLTANTWITRPEHAALVASYSSWLIAFGTWTLYVYELRGGKLLQERRP
jgi:hypothetical protein